MVRGVGLGLAFFERSSNGLPSAAGDRKFNFKGRLALGMVSRLTKYDALISRPTATVSEVLARIDEATPNLFQIIVSDSQRVLGTVTDGDLRRAILGGATLDSIISNCMRETPIVGRVGEDKANRTLVSRLRFLPVVDENERLDHILVDRGFRAQTLRRALVMAGGFGRRLGDLTEDTPKPLLSVAGRPILDRVLEQLETSGISRVHISTHFRSEKVEDFIKQRKNSAQIFIFKEETPLGTAGALACLADEIDEPVLVINGDVLCQVDLAMMHEFHTRHGYDGTIAVSRHETKIPFGVIRQTDDGQFAGIDEKPCLNFFVAAGIYYLSPEFIALTPRGRAVDMPEVITMGASAGLKIGLFPVHEYWKDVGAPADFSDAQLDHAVFDSSNG